MHPDNPASAETPPSLFMLPAEIIDLIVEELHADVPTKGDVFAARSCSLVSFAWLRPTRRLHFHTLKLDNDAKCTALLAAVHAASESVSSTESDSRCPRIACDLLRFVRNVRVICGLWTRSCTALWSLAKMLPVLHEYTLDGGSKRGLSIVQQEDLWRLANGVNTLSVRDWRDGSYESFFTFLARADLTHLSLRYILLATSVRLRTLATPQSAPPSLRSLSLSPITRSASRPLLKGIAVAFGSKQPLLEARQYSAASVTESNHLRYIMPLLGAPLRYLHLGLLDIPAEHDPLHVPHEMLDLSEFPALHAIHIGPLDMSGFPQHRNDDDWWWIHRLIATARSASLRIITISIILGYLDPIYSYDWPALTRIVQLPALGQLETVRIEIGCWDEAIDEAQIRRAVQSAVEHNASSLGATGLLHIVKVDVRDLQDACRY